MKKTYDDLLRRGMLTELAEPGLDQARRLIRRARIELSTGKKLLEHDEPAAMDMVYKAQFHAANALLRIQGYRPGALRQHEGVIEAIRRSIGEEHDLCILAFDRLRKRRNQFEYQAIYAMSGDELRAAIESATRFVRAIEIECKKSAPQAEFEF